MIIMAIIHNVCLFTTGLPVPILQNLKHEEFLIGTFFFFNDWKTNQDRNHAAEIQSLCKGPVWEVYVDRLVRWMGYVTIPSPFPQGKKWLHRTQVLLEPIGAFGWKLSRTFLRAGFPPCIWRQPSSKYEGSVGGAMLTLGVLEYFLCLLNEWLLSKIRSVATASTESAKAGLYLLFCIVKAYF